ncbi:MAG TPA: HAMP domain-containing sensor histidine kinase [Polyangiaceae bacterium]|nr:HAMP domain-containing sensor histidine kinase [Polyangiaceae bacterium]
MKLENRLALLTGAVTAGTITVCLVTALVLVRRSATRELDEEVVDGAKAAAVVVSELELQTRDGAAPSRIDIPEDTELMVRRLAIYSKDGRRIATRPEGAEFPEQLNSLMAMPGVRFDQPFDLTVREGHMRAILVSRRRLHGMTLLHAVSRDQLDEVIDARTRLFAGLFVATLAVVVLAALWLGRRLAADVNYVTAVARRVAAGELSARAGDAKLTNPETRNLARELDHMISELAALMAAQRNFISYAAHELRSPLAALQGELQLALRRPRTEEGYVETLGDALTEVAGLTQLTEDLLTLAHAQAESTVIASARVGSVVEEAVRLVQGVAQIQEATVERNVSAVEDAVVCGMEADLARLLRNLLENAIKFGPAGGQVRVTGQAQSSTIVLAVTDQGPGIAPADRAGLFAPFYRGNTKATARTPGTGLGLAIAREIARKYGGDVTLDDSYTKGTRMVIRLPLAPPPTSIQERASSRMRSASF